jgi:hypothetical protein
VNWRLAAKVGGLAVGTVMTMAPAGCHGAWNDWHNGYYGPGGYNNGYGNNNGYNNGNGSQVVVIRTDPGTCWTVTMNGQNHHGCGNASFSDGGSGGAQLSKEGGQGSVDVQMQSHGRTVDSGSVSSPGHYVSVHNPGNG